MTTIILTLIGVTAIVVFSLGTWRWTDLSADQAQRCFRFAIQPGAPLYTVAEISMEGELGLGNKARPNYMPMRAEQILAAPHGFIWRLRAGAVVRFAGSDGTEDGKS